MLIKDEQLTPSEGSRSSKSNDSSCPPVPLTSVDFIFSTSAPILVPMNNELPPPYSNDLFISEINKVEQNYPLGVTLETLNANLTAAEKENVKSLQNLNSLLSVLDGDLSRILGVVAEAKNTDLNVSGIYNNSCETTVWTKSVSENLISSEEMRSELTEIRSQLSADMTREKCINLIWSLKKIIEKFKLQMSKLIPRERNLVFNELLDIEFNFVEILEKKKELNPLNTLNCMQLKNNNQNVIKISMDRNESSVVNSELHSEKVTTKNIIMIKILEMLFSAMYILFLEIRLNQVSYVFDISSRIVCIFGFCGTLILIGNYVKDPNSDSDKKLLKWDLAFCTFMCLSYIWITFTIIFAYHFYIVYPVSTLVIFSFLMQLIYFLEIRNILICRRN